MVSCNHEEALDSLCCSRMVKANDTDVLVIAVGVLSVLMDIGIREL